VLDQLRQLGIDGGNGVNGVNGGNGGSKRCSGSKDSGSITNGKGSSSRSRSYGSSSSGAGGATPPLPPDHSALRHQTAAWMRRNRGFFLQEGFLPEAYVSFSTSPLFPSYFLPLFLYCSLFALR
jgi:hypothetical protein